MAVIARNGDSGSTVTISAAGTVSTAFDARGDITYGIVMPATFTGAALTFEVSANGTGGWVDLYDDTGAEVTLAVVQGRAYTLPAALAPWPYFRVVSGSTEGSARSITVLSKG